MKFQILAFCIVAVLSHAEEKVKKGQVFPSQEMDSLMTKKRGDPQNLAKGKKLTLVDFWASWCKPCEKSLPQLNELYKDFKNRGFLIVGVNVDEKKDEGKNFLKDKRVKFPVLYDDGRKLIDKVGVSIMPTSFLLDSKGEVILVHHGFREGDKEKLLAEIKKALK